MNRITRSHSRNSIKIGLLLAGASACSLDNEVSVGRTGNKLDIDRCYAVDSGCDAAFEGEHNPAFETIECTEGSRLVTMEVPLPDVVLCEGECRVPQGEVKAGPDGTYWILWETGSRIDGEEVPWLYVEHVAADGTLLGLERIDPEAQVIDAMLAVDDAGGAAVATFTQYSPDADSAVDLTATLYSYRPDVALRRPPLELVGVASPILAIDSSGDYVVAGNAHGPAKRGLIGRIRLDGTLAVTNNQIQTRGSSGRGIVSFTATGDVGYTLLAEDPDSNDSSPTFQILRYDSAFLPSWTAPLLSPAGPGHGASMVTDPEGRVVAAAVAGDALGSLSLEVYGHDTDGFGRFAFSLDRYSGYASVPQMEADRRSSKVWLNFYAPVTLRDEGVVRDGATQMVMIDAAAGTCEWREYDLFEASADDAVPELEGTETLVPTPVIGILEDRIVRLAEVAH